MYNLYKVLVITTLLYLIIIVAETVISGFNLATLLIAFIGWIPLFVITLVNEQQIYLNSLFKQDISYGLEKDKELVEKIRISYPPLHAFVPVFSQRPANLDKEKSNIDEKEKNESVQTLESLYGENSVHKNEEK